MTTKPKRSIPAPLERCKYLLSAALIMLLMLPAAPAQSDATREYQAHPLKYQSAADVQKLLADLLPELSDNDLIVDSRSNQILLRGSKSAQQVARQLIKSVDRPEKPPAEQKSTVIAYRCPPNRLRETANMVRKAYPDDQQVRIAANKSTSQLFIVAPPRVQAEIVKQLKAIGIELDEADSPAEMTDQTENQVDDPGPPRTPLKNRAERVAAGRRRLTRRVELYIPLENTNLRRVEKSLGDLFRARFRPYDDDRFDYLVSGVSGATVEIGLDRRRQGISLSGPQGMAAQLAALIRMLDSPPQLAGRRVRIVPVRRSDPSKVEQAIEAYRDGYRARKTTHRKPATLDDRENLPGDERQGARPAYSEFELVVFQDAPKNIQNDRDPGGNDADPPLTENDDARELDRVRDLGPDVEIETLPDLDVIIIQGHDRDVDEVTRIIKEIERLSAETVPVIDVAALQHVGSEAAAQLIMQVHDDLVGGRQGRVSITPLVKPNSLLLIGWGESVKAIKELIEKLDQPVEPETQLKVFQLRNAAAVSASATIQQFFAGRTGLGPKVKVNPDPRSNSLIVQAAPRDMQEISLLLEKIDIGKSKAVNQVRIFKLKNSLAADLAATLQTAITAAAGGQGAAKSSVLELLTVDSAGEKILQSGILADVRITPDTQKNTLVVTAPAESMDLLETLIRRLDESPSDVVQIKVFRIINGDATSLVQMLRSLLPSQTGPVAVPQLSGSRDESSLAPLRFSVELRTNSIIASGSAGDLRIIEALLLRLDEKEAQQRTNTVYRLKNAPATDVARAINDFLRSERIVQQAAPGSINPFQQIESEVVVVPEPVSNTLILSATARFFDEINELVQRLDEQPPQVMIQVLIAEVALNDTDEFGIELGLQDSLLFDRSLLGELVTTTNSSQSSTASGIVTATNEIIQAASNTPGFLFNGSPLGNLPNSGSTAALGTSNSLAGQALSNFATGRINSELGFGGLVLSASSESVSVLIRALQETRRMEILSRPQIMTLDNQPAFIQVGQRVPRIVASNITETGGQVNTVELTNVGILLGVTPRISPEGMVVMDIDAEKSDVGPDAEGIPVTVAPEGTIIRSPRINVTQAQTTVSAASGETIVLGGLISKGTSEIHRRVPWLADIPLLGDLFRFDSLVSRRTELLIIMTPHVIRDAGDAEIIKQQEAARMHWCASDVHEIHGEAGLCNSIDCPICNGAVPVIYPDLNPRGDLPTEIVPGETPTPFHETVPPEPIAPQQGELRSPSAFQRLSRMLRPPLFSRRFREAEESRGPIQINPHPENPKQIRTVTGSEPAGAGAAPGPGNPDKLIREVDQTPDVEVEPRPLFVPDGTIRFDDSRLTRPVRRVSSTRSAGEEFTSISRSDAEANPLRFSVLKQPARGKKEQEWWQE